MIRMSRFLAFVLGLAALASAGCGHGCTEIGCFEGLVLSFTGFPPRNTYEITVAVVTPTPEIVPIMTCTLSGGAGAQALSCSSAEPHSELGNHVTINDTSLKRVQVTVSSDSGQLAQQTVDVTYASREINGPGCGVCANATIVVAPSSTL